MANRRQSAGIASGGTAVETAALINGKQTIEQSRRLAAANKVWESALFRFILVGGFSAIVDLGSTLFLRFAFEMTDNWSKAIGFILGTLTAYLINRRWTFNAAPSTRRFIITMLTYGLTFIVQVGLYRVGIPWLEGFNLNAFWVRVFSFIIAQGTATILNFLIQRFFIFRVKEEAR